MTQEIMKKDFGDYITYGYIHNGTKDFIFHKENGPAIINQNETQEWYKHGKLHREDGPAFIDSNGTQEWWFHDKCVTNKIVKWLTDHDIVDYKYMTEEDKFALTFFMRSL